MINGQLRGDWGLLKVLVDLRREERITVGTAWTSAAGKKFLKVLTVVLFRFLASERLERMRRCPSSSLPPWPLFLELLDKDRPFGHACS